MTSHQFQPPLLLKTLPPNGAKLSLVSKKQQILSFINTELATLNDNWDGYGAVPIEKEVLSHLDYLIGKLPNPLVDTLKKDSILPNPNGTISIEWSKNSYELFLEIGNHYATYYIKHNGKIETINNQFILSNNLEFRQFIKYLKSYF